MISDMFPPQLRGLAMSIFTWGIYFGYGISYAIGNYVSAADIMGQVGALATSDRIFCDGPEEMVRYREVGAWN